MTISIPDLTVSFASHLPDDVTEIHVTRTGWGGERGEEGLVLFHVAKGDPMSGNVLTVNHVESEMAIELSRGNVGIVVAERVHAQFDEYERNRTGAEP